MNPARMIRVALTTVTLLYAVALVTVTHLPPSRLPATGVSDKLEHLFAYGLLGALAALTARAHLNRRVPFRALTIGLAAFGALDEITQPLVGRTADVWDWAADVGGIVVSVGLVWAWNCVRNTGCDATRRPCTTPGE